MAMDKRTRSLLLAAGAGVVLYWLYNQSQNAAVAVVTGAAPALGPPTDGSQNFYGPFPSSGGQASSGYDMTTGSYVGGG